MTDRRRDLLLGIATVAYVAGAIALLTSDQPLTIRIAIVQTLALFGCGALIVRRTDTPVVGWLLVVPGVTFNLLYAFAWAGDLPVNEDWTRWLAPLANLGILSLALLLLVFPTGRVPSRAARAAAGFAVVGQLASMALEYLTLAGVIDVDSMVGANVMLAVFITAVVVGLVEQVRRYRRRPRAEQQQVKWFLLAIVGQFAYVAAAVAGIPEGTVAFAVIDNVATMLWPITILIAISRYRLYEIDRIISRTLGYGLVVALLGAVFVGGVALVSGLLPTQDRLGVAVTTVAVVALFDPLRRRVLAVVDQRFDRARFEAERVVEAFGREVRNTTDLADVRQRLDDVLARTLAPATVAVWHPGAVADPGPDSTPPR